VCTLNVYVSLHPIRNRWGERKDFLGFCFVSRCCCCCCGVVISSPWSTRRPWPLSF
jgi:hypothetical protein